MVCVLQEGGDINVIDASNGTVAHEYVAKVKMNSNWACDKENQKLLVVGDVGRACLLDMSLVSLALRKRFSVSIGNSPVRRESIVSPTKKTETHWKMTKE